MQLRLRALSSGAIVQLRLALSWGALALGAPAARRLMVRNFLTIVRSLELEAGRLPALPGSNRSWRLASINFGIKDFKG